jgi:lysophospholipase L1-like esterase
MCIMAAGGVDGRAYAMPTKSWAWHPALLVAAADRSDQAAAREDDWVAPMKKVHARFTGRPGTFAQFGDSITVTRAFWTGLQWDRKNAPPEMTRAYELAKKHMRAECWDWKGPQFGSEGGMTIRWAQENVDKWLGKLNPEAALIMFGTNDLGGLGLAEYESKTRQVVQRCLDRGTVVILSTIPPKHGQVAKAAEFAEAVRRIAREMKLPLSDYQAEILRRRPDDWDGAMAKFKALPGDTYDVPTLVARDGVHPSNPRKYAGDFSEEALRSSGYGLRSYLTLLKYAEVIRAVLGTERDERK